MQHYTALVRLSALSSAQHSTHTTPHARHATPHHTTPHHTTPHHSTPHHTTPHHTTPHHTTPTPHHTTPHHTTPHHTHTTYRINTQLRCDEASTPLHTSYSSVLPRLTTPIAHPQTAHSIADSGDERCPSVGVCPPLRYRYVTVTLPLRYLLHIGAARLGFGFGVCARRRGVRRTEAEGARPRRRRSGERGSVIQRPQR